MASCPEPGCYGGQLYYGVGPLHEKETTGCPRCGGSGQVADPIGGRGRIGGGTTQELGCLGTIVYYLVVGVVVLAVLGTIASVLLMWGLASWMG